MRAHRIIGSALLLASFAWVGCESSGGGGELPTIWGPDGPGERLPDVSEEPNPPGDGQQLGLIPVSDDCSVPYTAGGAALLTDEDVVYSPAGGGQGLDIVRPAEGGPHPLVVLVHGGAWGGGDKADFRWEAEVLAGLGFATAAVNYRLSDGSDNTFPAGPRDLRCAVRWLRVHAADFAIDGTRVALVGHSAGAHLAALTGAAWEDPWFDADCPVVGGGGRVSAVIAVSGPFDLRPEAFGGHAEGEWHVEGLLGGSAASLPQLAAAASPVSYADDQDPATLLLHGTDDATVPVGESRRYAAALSSANVVHTLIEVPGAAHNLSLLEGSAESRTADCTTLAFLDAMRAN